MGLVGVILTGFAVLLPAYLSSGAFYRAVTGAGLPEFHWDVRRIGATGADIARIHIGPADAPALLADTLRLDYTPTDLARHRIQRAVVTGLEVWCGIDKDQFFIRSIDLETLAKQFSSTDSSANGPQRPAFLPETIEIRHSRIRFTWGNQVFSIPVDLRITTSPDHIGRFQVRIDITFFDRRIVGDGEVDLASGNTRWRITAPGLPLASMAQTAGLPLETTASGSLNVAADVAFQITPFTLKSAAVRVESDRYRIRTGPLMIRDPDGGYPLSLDIVMTDNHEWDIRLTGLSLASPLPATLSRLAARITPTDDGIDGQGDAVFRVPLSEADRNDGTGKGGDIPVPIAFTFDLSPPGTWRLTLTTLGTVNLSVLPGVQWGRTVIHGAILRVAVSGEGNPDGGILRCVAETGPVRVAGPGLDMCLKSLAFDGEIHFENFENVRVVAALKADAARMSTGTGSERTTAHVLSSTVSGKGRFSRTTGLSLEGSAEITDGAVEVPDQRVRIAGIQAVLPLAWPWAEAEERGTFSIAALRWKGQGLGSLKGGLLPRPQGLGFEGRFFSRTLPGLVLKITGEAPFLSPGTPFALSWSTRYRPSAPLDLGRFESSARGTTVDGILTVKGRMNLGGGAPLAGTMEAALSGGGITQKKKGIRVENIRLNLHFPELPVLRSAPDQRLTVGRLTMGEIQLENADIRFQIEPETAILIEKGHFKWCGGNVDARSFRINPGITDVDLVLYCDRLNLARLLGQLGAARAEGEGAVNGRLPIRLRKGRLVFDDGFLYSTPGDGGVIHITGAQVLTAGIPRNTPQFAQVDLAVEALKSYEYAWAKLKLASKGENLRLELQFDGRPTSPLPFVYSETFGGFVRVDASHPGSRFEGIRLDVNLGLPLDKILRYKGLVEMIQ